MSALPAVTSWEALELPSREQIQAVLESLSPEGAQAFAQEFFEALQQSKDDRDLRPLQTVVDAWYGTLLFVKKYPRPSGLADLKASRKREKPMTYKEVKAHLGT